MSGEAKGFFGRLRARLNRGSSTLAREIRTLLQGRQIDARLLEELEERLISADVGVEASAEILADLKAQLAGAKAPRPFEEIEAPEEVLEVMRRLV